MLRLVSLKLEISIFELVYIAKRLRAKRQDLTSLLWASHCIKPLLLIMNDISNTTETYPPPRSSSAENASAPMVVLFISIFPNAALSFQTVTIIAIQH